MAIYQLKTSCLYILHICHHSDERGLPLTLFCAFWDFMPRPFSCSNANPVIYFNFCFTKFSLFVCSFRMSSILLNLSIDATVLLVINSAKFYTAAIKFGIDS